MPTTINLISVRDAHVYSGTSNFNLTNYVAVGATTTDQAYGFFSFNTNHGIPVGAIITSCIFHGYVLNGQENYNKTLVVRPASAAWTETGITGQNKPTSTGVFCNITLGAGGSTFAVDITPIAQAWFGGAFNYEDGLYLTSSDTTSLKNIASRTNGTVANRPYIVIEYMNAASEPTVSASISDLGVALTIYTNRANSSYTHTLSYSFAGTTGTIATGVALSKLWTPSLDDLAPLIPAATFGICTITCDTYSGSTLIGSRTVQVTLTVPSTVIPTIGSFTATRVNGTLVPSAWAVYVQGKSKATLTISNADGVYGSTISDYLITGVGYTKLEQSFTTEFLTTSGTLTFTAIVTDSRRQQSAPRTVNITVYSYSPPYFSTQMVYRSSASGVATNDGTYLYALLVRSISSVNGKNSATSSLKYKLSTSSTYSGLTVIPNNTGEVLDGITLSADSSYDVIATITDGIQAIEYPITIPSSIYTMHFKDGGLGVAVGKAAEDDNTFEVNPDWDVLVHGYELGEKISTIESDISGISTLVEDTLDNLEIDGTNKFIDSELLSLSNWTLSSVDNVTLDSTVKYDGYNSVKLTRTAAVADTLIQARQEFGLGEWWNPGEEITLSAYVRCNDLASLDYGGRIEIGFYNGTTWTRPATTFIAFTLTEGVWERITVTATIPIGTIEVRPALILRRNGTIWYALPKLELGNKVTGWSPSPKDIIAPSQIDTTSLLTILKTLGVITNEASYVQTGSVTGSTTGVAVTFSPAFAGTPFMTLTPSSANIYPNCISTSSTGTTIRANANSGSINWKAEYFG